MGDEQRYREAEQRLWASVGVSATEATDADVRVLEVGEGPAVLFVHGASNSGASWAAHRVPLRAGGPPGLRSEPPAGDHAGHRRRPKARRVTHRRRPRRPRAGVGACGRHLLRRLHGAAHRGCPPRAHRPHGAPRLARGRAHRAPAGVHAPGQRAGARAAHDLHPPTERAVRALLARIGLGNALATGGFSDEALDCYVSLLRHTDTMRNEYAAGRFITPRIASPTLSWRSCPTPV